MDCQDYVYPERAVLHELSHSAVLLMNSDEGTTVQISQLKRGVLATDHPLDGDTPGTDSYLTVFVSILAGPIMDRLLQIAANSGTTREGAAEQLDEMFMQLGREKFFKEAEGGYYDWKLLSKSYEFEDSDVRVAFKLIAHWLFDLLLIPREILSGMHSRLARGEVMNLDFEFLADMIKQVKAARAA